MDESCHECELLRQRVTRNRGDLQRAARRALRGDSAHAHRETVRIRGRLQRAQRDVVVHTSAAHGAAGA